MIRYEPPGADICIRYDGTECRVHICRYEEGKSLTPEEIKEIIATLAGAEVGFDDE